MGKRRRLDFDECLVDVSFWDEYGLILWEKDESRMYHFNLGREYINGISEGKVFRVIGQDRTEYPYTEVEVFIGEKELEKIFGLHYENIKEGV